jgi:hypothetical protein
MVSAPSYEGGWFVYHTHRFSVHLVDHRGTEALLSSEPRVAVPATRRGRASEGLSQRPGERAITCQVGGTWLQWPAHTTVAGSQEAAEGLSPDIVLQGEG